MLCPTHLKTACDEFQNGIQKKALLLGGNPGNSFAPSSTDEAVMKKCSTSQAKVCSPHSSNQRLGRKEEPTGGTCLEL